MTHTFTRGDVVRLEGLEARLRRHVCSAEELAELMVTSIKTDDQGRTTLKLVPMGARAPIGWANARDAVLVRRAAA